MWFSEKAAGELPRGSSVQESGNITEARNTDALRHVTAHTSTPRPRPHRLTFLSRSVYQSVFKGIPQLVSTDFG